MSPRCYYFATLFCFRRWPEFIYLTAQQSRTCARAFHPPKEGESASLSRLKARNSIRVIGEPWLPSRASAIHMNGKSWKKNWRERERDNYYVYLYLRIMYRLEVKLFHRFFSNEKSYRWSFFFFSAENFEFERDCSNCKVITDWLKQVWANLFINTIRSCMGEKWKTATRSLASFRNYIGF